MLNHGAFLFESIVCKRRPSIFSICVEHVAGKLRPVTELARIKVQKSYDWALRVWILIKILPGTRIESFMSKDSVIEVLRRETPNGCDAYAAIGMVPAEVCDGDFSLEDALGGSARPPLRSGSFLNTMPTCSHACIALRRGSS